MCGITGIFAFNLVGKFNKIHITAATMSMEKRGPDYQDIYVDEWVGLGHRRLSVIDTSEKAHQPMWDASGRYCLVFNGEIFNFKSLREELTAQGIRFTSASDTEVLLKLLIREGKQSLSRLNGFFAFCLYDKQQQSFFLARDRFGVKPLYYFFDEDKFIFASGLNTILQYGIERNVDYPSLLTYLQLNYIPAPDTILRQVKKVLPGHCITLSSRQLSTECWYEIPYTPSAAYGGSYQAAQATFKSLLEESVQCRLVADVPLGTFLSGGIDSSVITGLARRHKPDLHTFSIGFRDEKFFDETKYARLVAKHFNTNHTVFSLTSRDLLEHVDSILNSMDEPFADSSAINVYILSKETRKHATVALSGDGADELLGGYHKHEALGRLLHPGWKENMIFSLAPLWRGLPKSRNNRITNFFRQAHRFAAGAQLSPQERYWRWATFADTSQALELLSPATRAVALSAHEERKRDLLRNLTDDHDFNQVLLTDMSLVLTGDMLVKTDTMSMAHGLEIRSPFLDYQLVNFVFTLPEQFKVRGRRRKRILQDAFRDFLPAALYNRPKKGFEVPLLNWLRRDMKDLVDDLLARERVEAQGIFDYAAIDILKRQLHSRNPGDVPARLWGLIAFQWWFRRHISQ